MNAPLWTRAQVVELVADGVRHGWHMALATPDTAVPTQFAKRRVPQSPPVVMRKRRVTLHGSLSVSFDAVDGCGTALFRAYDASTFQSNRRSVFHDLIYNAPDALRTKVAAALLDLIAQPDEPEPVTYLPVRELTDAECDKLRQLALNLLSLNHCDVRAMLKRYHEMLSDGAE